ncbi:unnamed protein product [Amaranthus hypochondriacus]
MAAGEGGGRGGPSVEFTPTWVAALVCTVIVLLSLVVERIIHALSKRLKKRNKRFLYKALKKVKEELLLLGFISLVLARLQDEIVNICIPIKWAVTGLPCKVKNSAVSDTISTIAHFSTSTRRHLLAETTHKSHCQKGKVPLISYHALHDLHILIFVLAVVHVVVCALTVLFGAAKISQWRQWENSILDKISNVDQEGNIINVKNDEFIKNRFMGIHANKRIWLHSFAKHLYSSVSESDYAAMRMGFVQVHCRDNPSFNFYEYMMHAFEADFAKVVSISGYAWVIVIISMLLNLAGWHMYFWIAFLPFIILLIVGTKLEQVITLLATEVVRRQSDGTDDSKIQPSDHYFWFSKPRIVHLLIHIIISCNSFAIALFFWIHSRYGLQACSMDKVIFTIPRLIIVVFVQILSSYSTLPLYAIVTQMGSSYHKEAMKYSGVGSIRGGTVARFESAVVPEETIQSTGEVHESEMCTHP